MKPAVLPKTDSEQPVWYCPVADIEIANINSVVFIDQVVTKLLEKSSGRVFVNRTELSINVIGFVVPRRFVVPLTSNAWRFPEMPIFTYLATYRLPVMETSDVNVLELPPPPLPVNTVPPT